MRISNFLKPNVEKMSKNKDVKGLTKALKYKNDEENIKSNAAYYLGEIRDKRAVEPLIQALMNEERKFRYFRIQAAEALGKVGDVRSIEPLIHVLTYDNDIIVKNSVAESLERLSWAPENDLQKMHLALAKKQWNELERIGKPVVQLLIQYLNDEDWEIRRDTSKSLGNIGDARAVKPLILALNDEDGTVRPAAAESLGKMGEPAVWPLAQALMDKKGDAQDGAYLALTKIGKIAVEPLIQVLKDGGDDARWLAAKVFFEIGDERAVEPLIEALKDKIWDVRKEAAYALGKIGDKKAVEPLIEALKDRNSQVRNNVGAALGEIGDKKALEPLIQALHETDEDGFVIRGISSALVKIEPGLEHLVTQALHNENLRQQKKTQQYWDNIGRK